MAKKRGSKYKINRERNREEARKRQGGGGTGTLKLPEGAKFFNLKEAVDAHNIVEIDIIPFPINETEIVATKTIFQHRNVGPEKKAFLCPKTKAMNARCPICEQAAIDKDDTSKSPEEANALKYQIRTLFNVIDCNNRDAGIQIWEVSNGNFAKQLDAEIKINEEFEDYADVEDGYTLKVRFANKSFSGTKYLEADRIDFIERDKPYSDGITDEAFNLDSIPVVLSYDQLSAVMMGMDSEEEDGDDEIPYHSDKDEKKTSRRRKEVIEEDTEEEVEDNDTDSDNPCPADGNFGVDIDELDECEECDVWDDCAKEKKQLKKKSRK